MESIYMRCGGRESEMQWERMQVVKRKKVSVLGENMYELCMVREKVYMKLNGGEPEGGVGI